MCVTSEVTMSKTVSYNPSDLTAYIITGPTSGIGRATALELAKHGTVVLVGRDQKKLDEVQGEWKPGGSKMPGADAYATSKQCNLATVLELARQTSRLGFNAVEPGFNPGTLLSNILTR